MPKISYEDAKADYQLWKEAERALATGTSYTIAGRSLTRTDMSVVNEKLRYYGRIIDQYEGRGTRKMRGITTFDR